MWPQLFNTALGIWLMAAPAVLEYGRPASTNDHIIGPLIATFACIAIWESSRSVRWVNLPLGLWLIAAPLDTGSSTSGSNQQRPVRHSDCDSVLSGGAIQQRFAGGWSALWRDAAQ